MEHMIRLDIEAGTDTFLYQAVKRDDMDMVMKVLRIGALASGQYSGYMSRALRSAVQQDQRAMVHVLLRNGTNGGLRGPCSLSDAIQIGREDIALLLWRYVCRHWGTFPH